jgi:hypothetical protein
LGRGTPVRLDDRGTSGCFGLQSMHGCRERYAEAEVRTVRDYALST